MSSTALTPGERAAAITAGVDAFCRAFGESLRELKFGEWEDFTLPGQGDTLTEQRASRYDGYTEVCVAVRRLALEQGVKLAMVPIPDGLRLMRLDKARG